MKISSIPQLYKNFNRAIEILRILVKYGLADWLSSLDIVGELLKDNQGGNIRKYSREARIRLALSELGVTFIKIGQILSSRPDIVGKPLADELSKLQCGVIADKEDLINARILEELGEPVDKIFKEFSSVPFASASIGQVHMAKLHSGEEVVVKIQHIGVDKKIARDMEILLGLAGLAEKSSDLALYNPSSLIQEMNQYLKRELDFIRELQNLENFAKMFAKNPSIKIPTPWRKYSTSKVLTMEKLTGYTLTDKKLLLEKGFDLQDLAKKGADLYIEMIFKFGVYHADPHPGNILVIDHGVIGLIDFGMVGRVDDNLREDLEDMILSIADQNVQLLTMIVKRLGRIPQKNFDEPALKRDLADYVSYYGMQDIEHLNLSAALQEMVSIIQKYRISLPSQVGMLLKVLIMLEGTSKQLNPNFTLMEIILPYKKEFWLRRLSPEKHIKRLYMLLRNIERVTEGLPERLNDLLLKTERGKLTFHLNHETLEPSVNKLVLSMMTSALFLGSTFMLVHKVPPIIFKSETMGLKDISLFGFAGCVFSVVFGIYIFLALFREERKQKKSNKE